MTLSDGISAAEEGNILNSQVLVEPDEVLHRLEATLRETELSLGSDE